MLEALTRYDLDLKSITGFTSDTDSTMNKLWDVLEGRAEDGGANTKCVGCIAHLLELTTGHAWGAEGKKYHKIAMQKCRDLVTYFHSSNLATELLIRTQKAQMPPTMSK